MTTLNVAAAKKGFVMKISNKKNYLSHILLSFIIFLFAASLTMNVLYDDTTHFKVSLSSDNNSHTETVTKNIYPIPIIAAIPKGFSLLFFLIN